MQLPSAVNRQGCSLYLLLLACLLLAPWAAASFNIFGLDRDAAGQGQFWRLWTGHFVHLSWSHLLLNAVGIALLQQLFGGLVRPAEWLLATVLIAPAVALCWLADFAGMSTGQPRFDFVVGISGLLHGLFTYSAVVSLRRDSLLAGVVLLAMLAKVLSETLFGSLAVTERIAGLPVVTDMHAYGVEFGLLLGVGALVAERR